jgi:hypothetical protein
MSSSSSKRSRRTRSTSAASPTTGSSGSRPIIREWWVRSLDQVIAPWVRERGYDWEFTITEPPFDLWSLQGEIPPPFESVAEKRWVQENKATPYTQAEKLPVSLALAPGTTGE